MMNIAHHQSTGRDGKQQCQPSSASLTVMNIAATMSASGISVDASCMMAWLRNRAPICLAVSRETANSLLGRFLHASAG